MSSHEKLGRMVLKGLVDLRESKGNLSLEDVGGMFVNIAKDINPDTSEADLFLHQEISRLASYIEDAKVEIFSISANDKQEDVLIDASQHLDEVIKHTEEATTVIMDSADVVMHEAGGIGGDKEEKIMAAVNEIYESCNFQDITGQRIQKVMKLIATIEERVAKLNDLFGTAGAENDALQGGAKEMTDADLLNGPQLSESAASQEEIDQLFASLGGK